MSDIITISELLKNKQRKEEELEFYKSELEKLNLKMSFLKRDIEITNTIIDIIEKEKIVEVKPE